jgi:FlaA1/EpsC-like NDP-sugar epimerase
MLETFRPEAVFHAAAHKHVHLMEVNPCEAITNNVTGTRNLVEQSVALGVSRFVQVSTDKAVQPTSIMGASKRVCEMIVQAQVRRGNGLFCCVRFGNVLGSRGSVVPIFQEQIRHGGPVTVTHQDAQRFLMTIPEAVGLLIQAGTLANNRDIFVLDMGEPVLIHKLAEDMIELSGLLPNRDIRIEITGLKPGEKLSEVLIDNASELHPTSVEKIRAIKTEIPEAAIFATRLRGLERAAWEGNVKDVYQQLAALNIGYAAPVPARMWPVTPTRVIQAPAAARALAPELS